VKSINFWLDIRHLEFSVPSGIPYMAESVPTLWGNSIPKTSLLPLDSVECLKKLRNCTSVKEDS
jgi:hypothetical protein